MEKGIQHEEARTAADAEQSSEDERRELMREQRAAEAAAAVMPVITRREEAQIRAVPPHFTERVARLAVTNGMGT